MRTLRLLALLCLVAVPVLASGPVGLNVHTAGTDLLDRAAETGIGWVRIDFIWLVVEFENDRFDWSLYDRLIADAEARDLRVFATIAATPAWATDGSAGSGVPRDPNDWWDFCYRAAARYRGRVHAWGLWNEPNLGRFWDGSRLEYIVSILRPGAQAIRAADPSALACGPELAHLDSAGWDNWLRETVAATRVDLDVVTHHLYPDGTSAGSVVDGLEDGGSLPWQSPAVREVLDDAGWRDRAFWLTETGARSGSFNEQGQAEFYFDLLDRYFPQHSQAGWIDAIFFYELADDPLYPEDNFGILGPPPDYEPKRVVTVLTNAIDDNPAYDGEFAAAPQADVLTPEATSVVPVEVRNTGETAWIAGLLPTVLVEEAPSGWQIGADGPVETVPPGGSGIVGLAATPPPFGQTDVNQTVEVRLRLIDPNGRRFGSPRRVSLTAGWHVQPVVEGHPTAQVAVLGEDVQFRAAVQGGPDVRARWYRNGRPLSSAESVFTGRVATLDVRDVSRADTGEYRLALFSDAGAVWSRPAQLLIAGDPDLAPREGAGRAGDGSKPAPTFDDVFPPADRERGLTAGPRAE